MQERLRLAAKARIMRMVKPKSKRKELQAPEWVMAEWKTGNKNIMADILCQANFDQDYTHMIAKGLYT